MDLNNVTFGETAGVESATDLRALVYSLQQRIISLEKELQQVKSQTIKLEQLSKKSTEVVDHRYQIYFKAPKTSKQVV